MAKSFGTWLTRYKGHRVGVKCLGLELKAALRRYGMQAGELMTPNEVFAFLAPSGEPDPNLLWHLQKAADIWPGPGASVNKRRKEPTRDLWSFPVPSVNGAYGPGDAPHPQHLNAGIDR